MKRNYETNFKLGVKEMPLPTNLNQKIIKPKVRLLELAKQSGNVSSACKTMGYGPVNKIKFVLKFFFCD